MSFIDKIKHALSGDWDDEDQRFRAQHNEAAGRAEDDYARCRPAYQFGYDAGRNPELRGRSFAEVEPELRNGWTADAAAECGTWDEMRGFVNQAYDRGQERTLTLSDEQLGVDKRTVRAGEVDIRKTVETQRVSEQVPVVREEIELERHAVTGDRVASTPTADADLRKERAVVDDQTDRGAGRNVRRRDDEIRDR